MSETLREMQEIVRGAAGAPQWGDTKQAGIARAARRLGLSFRRARSLWYAEPGVKVWADEADRLRRLRDKA